MYWMFATSSILKSPLARARNAGVHELTLRRESCVGLGNAEHVLFVGGEVFDSVETQGMMSTPAREP